MNTDLRSKITSHGTKLLAMFPHATEADPVKLCKALRRIESAAASVSLRACNTGPSVTDKEDAAILNRVDKLLNFRMDGVPVIFNKDPRGYALKIDDAWMRKHSVNNLEQDWGGYGLIAPDFTA